MSSLALLTFPTLGYNDAHMASDVKKLTESVTTSVLKHIRLYFTNIYKLWYHSTDSVSSRVSLCRLNKTH